jgi:hypothetical protein
VVSSIAFVHSDSDDVVLPKQGRQITTTQSLYALWKAQTSRFFKGGRVEAIAWIYSNVRLLKLAATKISVKK